MTGTKVFLDYDQKALDDAYDQLVYAPNRDQIFARFMRNSEHARQRLGEPQRFAYGPSAIEALDVYRCPRANAPVHVYIHGGAWRYRSAAEYGFAAEMFLHAGAHFVVPDFIGIVEAGGNLLVIAEQLRRALGWVCDNAQALRGDPQRIYVSATSSGAHLAGVLATMDLPVKGYVLTSGMYDLRGPRLSKRSAYVKFTDEMEEALSPQRHLERIQAPIVLLYGSLETPEFQRQSREFATALRAAGKSVELIVAEHYNHFEIAETMGNPYGPVGRAILGQMGLGSEPGF
jgi:arylformamidase